jgi:hypothetical protein
MSEGAHPDENVPGTVPVQGEVQESTETVLNPQLSSNMAQNTYTEPNWPYYYGIPPSVFMNTDDAGVQQPYVEHMGYYAQPPQVWPPVDQEYIQQGAYGSRVYDHLAVPQLVGVPPNRQPYYYMGGEHVRGMNDLGQPVVMMPVSPINQDSAWRQSRSSGTRRHSSSTTDSTDAETTSNSDSLSPRSYKQRWRRQHRQVEGPSGANLFIYHLPLEVTDAELLTLFSPWGDILSVRVFLDQDTLLSKGFGFVSYASPEMAETAIKKMNKFRIGKKKLKVEVKR